MSAERLADAFADRVARWAERVGCPPASLAAVAEAARLVSLATSNGHVCVLVDESGADRAALLASGLVGTPDAPGALPLVLDDEGRLYLHRYFDYERRLARKLLDTSRVRPQPMDIPRLAERLSALFGTNEAAGEPDWQKVAAALALRRGLTIVSGGPGTGKTTTVVNLLACLLEENPDCRIALAAPTGKAAARMTEAIRARAGHLPESLRERLPSESFTLHRLLRYNPRTGAFVHGRDAPLAVDALIVDEASMLDLALATKLLEAVPAGSRVILLGDKDQLSAVEAGAVFAELCVDPSLTMECRAELAQLCGLPAGGIVPPPPVQASALKDAVVWLTRNYRFAADSGIGRLAADINAGRADEALAGLREGGQGVAWREEGSAVDEIAAAYAPYFDAVRRDAADVAAVSAAFGSFRALCAVREGRWGVDTVNEELERLARKAFGGSSSPWYRGRPVMVTRNDYVQKLFNGDIGIALPDAQGELSVFFPEGEGFRAVAPARMPPHETAFAMTVHKAQGSEFDSVIVLLPRNESRVATRELLYTAITRARRSVTLLASEEALRLAMAQKTRRRSGLLARLGLHS